MSGKLSREYLIELVTKIVEARGTEAEIDEWIDEFVRNVPHPEGSDLIFWSEKELTPEQIVDEALSYRPIELGPPQEE